MCVCVCECEWAGPPTVAALAVPSLKIICPNCALLYCWGRQLKCEKIGETEKYKNTGLPAGYQFAILS